jgi:hypothetical protein
MPSCRRQNRKSVNNPADHLYLACPGGKAKRAGSLRTRPSIKSVLQDWYRGTGEHFRPHHAKIARGGDPSKAYRSGWP